MNLQKCVRCKQRPAMVFITRLENGKSINEGLCLICARELGIKPVSDMLNKMGIDEGDMSAMLDGMFPDVVDSDDSGESEPGRIPTLNFNEIFGMGAQGKGKEKH